MTNKKIGLLTAVAIVLLGLAVFLGGMIIFWPCNGSLSSGDSSSSKSHSGLKVPSTPSKFEADGPFLPLDPLQPETTRDGEAEEALGLRKHLPSKNRERILMRRLTFSFRDGKIELVSQQQVEMRMPAQTVSRDLQPPREFRYELRDANSEVLYRLDAEDPIPSDVEVFSEDPKRNIERAPHAPKEGVFTVLVPEIEDAEEVSLLRQAAVRGAGKESVVEVGRFKLSKER